MSSTDLDTTLDQLNGSLDELEAALAPLASQSLEETLASLDGPIQRAKVLFWVAYTIHSCSWVHAKTRGVDVESHGVLEELKRIQPYNGKINAAAASGSKQAEEELRNMKIDKGAASRFIRAAISNQPKKAGSDSSFYTAKSTVQDPLEGPGKHSRLKSIANSGKRGPESGSSSSSSEEEDLKVHGDGTESSEKGKGKKRKEAPQLQGKKRKWTPEGDTPGDVRADSTADASEQPQSKAKKAEDPLQGYDDASEPSTKAKKRAEKKRKRQQLEQVSSASTSAAASPVPSVSGQSNQGEAEDGTKKNKKKNKKKDAAE